MKNIKNGLKSTLERGNNLLKEVQFINPKKQTAYIDDNQEHLDIQKLYDKVKPYAQNNQKRKKNIINILNYANHLWNQFLSNSNKSGQICYQYLQKFKIVQARMNDQLNHLIIEDSLESVNQIKLKINKIVDYLQQRARKFKDKKKQLDRLIKNRQEHQQTEQNQEQAIKQQMLDLINKFKTYAINISDDLKKDEKVISKINQKQDKQLTNLKAKSLSLEQIIKQQRIGFFQLISMAGVGIAIWIFTLFFILVF